MNRSATLDELRRLRPRLLIIVAPAGYGKSTLVRQYVDGEAGVVECDCFGVRGALEMLRRLDAGLATPVEQTTLVDVAARLGALQAHLSARTQRTTLVLENAEALVDDRDARKVLAGALSVRNPLLHIVVCSRVGLPLRYGRFAGPDETAYLGLADLRLSREEMAAMLRTRETAVLERVEALTRGWPIVVSMIARLGAVAPLPSILDRLERLDYAALQTYLLEEVIGELDERVTATILGCIAASDGRLAEVKLARESDDRMAPVAEMLQRCPLVVAVGEARCEVHPLLRDALLARHGEHVVAVRRRLADALLERGSALRAAALYFALGDNESAARAIAAGDVFTRFDDRDLVRAMERLDTQALLRYPSLWNAFVNRRAAMIGQDELLAEALVVWSRAGEGTPVELCSHLAAIIVVLSLDLGQIDTAQAILRELGERLAADTTGMRHMIEVGCRTHLAIARCRDFDAELYARTVAPIIAEPNYALYSLMSIMLPVAAYQGDLDAVRRTCARIHAFDESVITYLHGEPLEQAAFYEWLIGDDRVYEHTLSALEGGPGTVLFRNRFFLESSRGRFLGAEPDARVTTRVRAALIAASMASTADERQRILQQCLIAGRATNSPWWHGLALLACALCDTPRREVYLREAARVLEGTELQTLRYAIGALRHGQPITGFFSAFAARCAKRPLPPAREIAISLARGAVLVDGTPIALGERRLELILFLASEGRPVHRAVLLDRLWPESDARSSANALRVLLSRLRRDLGADAIRRAGEHYLLDASVTTDLDRIEAALREIRSSGTLDEDARAKLRAEYVALCVDGASEFATHEWLAAVQTRATTLRAELAAVLHGDAAVRGEHLDAYAVARLLLDRDPTDELGCELAMRALLAAGDQRGARRELGAYAEALRVDLAAEPAEHLYRLLGG